MPINITIQTNWATRATIRNLISRSSAASKEDRPAIFRDLGQYICSKLSLPITEAISINDDRCKAKHAPLLPQRVHQQICIQVKADFGNGSFPLFVKETDTVEHLRSLVEAETDVESARQRFVFKEWELQDGKHLLFVS